MLGWTTHLKNMLVKLHHFPREGVKIEKYVKQPSRFEFTSHFWVLFLFATPLSRQSGSKLFSLCWFHPEKSPKILNPASKYQDHLPNPHFSGGELSVKLQGCILQPHIHATRTHHFFFECSWSCDRSGDRELQRCCCCCCFFKGKIEFFFFQKIPLQSPHVLSFVHLLGLAVWGSLIHRNVTRWFPPEKKNYVTIKKPPKGLYEVKAHE